MGGGAPGRGKGAGHSGSRLGCWWLPCLALASGLGPTSCLFGAQGVPLWGGDEGGNCPLAAGAAPAQNQTSPWLRPSAGAASGQRLARAPECQACPGEPAEEGACLPPRHPPVWGRENVASTPGQASAFLECAESLQGVCHSLPGRPPASPPPLPPPTAAPCPSPRPPIPSCSPGVSGCSPRSWSPVLAAPVGGGRKRQLADSSLSRAGARLQPAVVSRCVLSQWIEECMGVG